MKLLYSFTKNPFAKVILLLSLMLIGFYIQANAQRDNVSYPNGQILKNNYDNKYYIIIGSGKFMVNYRDISKFITYSGRILNVSNREIQNISTVPSETVLIQEISSKDVYLIIDGKKILIPTATLDLVSAKDLINKVPDGRLSRIKMSEIMLFDATILDSISFHKIKKTLAENYINAIDSNKYLINSNNAYGKYQNDRLYSSSKNYLFQIDSITMFALPSGGGPPFNPSGNNTQGSNTPDEEFELEKNPTLRGFADIHNHQFANLAFGCNHVTGSPYGRISNALAPCSITGEEIRVCVDDCIKSCGPCILAYPVTALACLIKCGIDLSGPHKPHGLAGGYDFVGFNIRKHYVDKSRMYALTRFHTGYGYPYFDNWVSWDNVNHQSVYQDWLFRAYQGGLRLMVMMAVENEFLCQSTNSSCSCNEMESVYRQIDAAKAMEKYIEINQGGWYKIVYSPEEAEKTISEGKLAVVLGIEVSKLLNCRRGIDDIDSDLLCNESIVYSRLDELYKNGIRHVFPIHKHDNFYGGTSYPLGIQDFPWSDHQYEIKTLPTNTNEQGKENVLGLSYGGEFLIVELIKRGMIIDVDHMSARSKNRVLDIATEKSYPGIVASHAGFLAINHGSQNHEGQLSDVQARRIYDLGGMVAPILNQAIEKHEVNYPQCKIKHNCSWTSETWAQAYFYAKDRIAEGRGIAIGTDFNGPIPPLGPRFGYYNCMGGGSNTNLNKLNYPFRSVFDGKMMNPSVSGYKTFNANEDGIIHVGMLPDMIAELMTYPSVDGADFEPFMTSAKYYIEMWRKSVIQGKIVESNNPFTPSPTNPLGLRDLSAKFNKSKFSNLSNARFRKLIVNISAKDKFNNNSISGDVYYKGILIGKTNNDLKIDIGCNAYIQYNSHVYQNTNYYVKSDCPPFEFEIKSNGYHSTIITTLPFSF